MNLTLLAYCPELDPTTKDAIGFESRMAPGGKLVKTPLEARFPYFEEGYVSADAPRDSAYTNDVVAATKGWALADESGRIVGKFKDYAKAAKAQANPKVKLEVEVESDEADAKPAAK